GVKVAAAGGEVVLLDIPDDRFPDPGLMADLADGETGLTAGSRKSFADAHARLHVLICPYQGEMGSSPGPGVITTVDSIEPMAGWRRGPAASPPRTEATAL